MVPVSTMPPVLLLSSRGCSRFDARMHMLTLAEQVCPMGNDAWSCVENQILPYLWHRSHHPVSASWDSTCCHSPVLKGTHRRKWGNDVWGQVKARRMEASYLVMINSLRLHLLRECVFSLFILNVMSAKPGETRMCHTCAGI